MLSLMSIGDTRQADGWAAIGVLGGRSPAIHDFAEVVHGAASKLFWPLIALHMAGALKHLVADRDGAPQRMLWVQARES